jgi:hypothetical protein
MAKDGLKLRHVIFVSDFKMNSFQAKIFQIQCHFPELKLYHVVHAPYHGRGACDGAKAPVVTHRGLFNHKKVGKKSY